MDYQGHQKIIEPLLAPGCYVFWGNDAVADDVGQLDDECPLCTRYT